MSDSDGVAEGVRMCRDCGEIKPLRESHVSPRRKGGRGSYCKPCFNERSKASYAKRVGEKHGRAVAERRPVPDGQRYCPDCGETKALEEFPSSRNDTGGRGRYCKPCHNARGRETKQRLYGGSREYHLRYKYGLSVAEFDKMLAGQGGLCAICADRNPAHVDHDHVSGTVRGILCFNCNGGLGQFRDNTSYLGSAITYLRGHQGRWLLIHPGVYQRFSPTPVPRPSPTS